MWNGVILHITLETTTCAELCTKIQYLYQKVHYLAFFTFRPDLLGTRELSGSGVGLLPSPSLSDELLMVSDKIYSRSMNMCIKSLVCMNLCGYLQLWV